VERVDFQGRFEHRNRLVEVLHFGIADADEVVGVRIARIELDGPLKAGKRDVELMPACCASPRLYQAWGLLGSSAMAFCRKLLASSSFCSVMRAIPSLIAAAPASGLS